MIRYALKCSSGHGFESWFQSAEAFDGLHATGHVACPVCGDSGVEKALMSPGVRSARAKPAQASAPAKPDAPLTAPANEMEAALADLRRKITENSDYVGPQFATQARQMHDGELPHRSIYGEVSPPEARSLIEDGVPVAPLPFIPDRKVN